MCFKVYSQFTVCGHAKVVDKEECETFSSLSTYKRVTQGCKSKKRAIEFVYGWCSECKSHFFHDVTIGPRGERVTHKFNSRDTMAIRRYWEYKRMIWPYTPGTIIKRDLLRAMATDDARQLASAHRASDESQLTPEEESFKRLLLLLRPSWVQIGPERYSYPFSDDKEVARMLHMVRIKTIAWANGDDKMYREDVNLPLHWEAPYAPEVWGVTRKDAV